MNDLEMIEKYAKMMALGNNGGSWATHYNEKQKDFWRGCAVKVITDCHDQLVKHQAAQQRMKASQE